MPISLLRHKHTHTPTCICPHIRKNASVWHNKEITTNMKPIYRTANRALCLWEPFPLQVSLICVCMRVKKSLIKDRPLSDPPFVQYSEREGRGMKELSERNLHVVRKPQSRNRGGEGKARHDAAFSALQRRVYPTLNSFPTQNSFPSCPSLLLRWYPRAKARPRAVINKLGPCFLQLYAEENWWVYI